MRRPVLWLPTVIIIVVAVSRRVSCDIFSSTSHLQNLMYLERHLVNSLYEYVEELEGKIARVRR